MESRPLLEGKGQPSLPVGQSTASVPSGSSRSAQGPPQCPQPLPQAQVHPPQPVQGGYVANPAVVAHQPQIQAGDLILNQKPPNHVILTLFVMLCCLFCGLMGLLAALQVDKAWSVGDRQRAYQLSRNAKRWSIGGIVCSCVSLTLIAIGCIVIAITTTLPPTSD